MSELVYASAECESCVAKRAEIAKLKNERDWAIELLRESLIPTTQPAGWEKWNEAVQRFLDEQIIPDIAAVCCWREDDADCGVWVGDCGVAWQFMSDGPHENRTNFCPRCGRRLRIVDDVAQCAKVR